MSAKLLKVNRRKEDYKLVGVYMPLWVNSYINLYTTAKGHTKSHVFRTLIENWVVQTREKNTEEELLNEIKLRVMKQWAISQVSMSMANFKSFITDELRKADLQASVIRTITDSIK